MARKKKPLKDLNEHSITHDYLQDHSLKRGSLDEHILQQNQKMKQQHEQYQYQSDGELLNCKQKLHLEKNKSQLFLIKSHSFIDKINSKRPKNLNEKTKPEEFKTLHTLMLKPNSPTQGNTNTQLEKSIGTGKQTGKMEKINKLKKPHKLKQIKKSKSINDSTENLKEIQDFLKNRRMIIAENKFQANDTAKRPQTISLAQNRYKPVTKSKTLDDIEIPQLKRESFIRYSLQSIRRSFSSTKKYQSNQISFILSSSSSSSTSATSDNAHSLKTSKSKENNKDIDFLKDIEDSKYLISEKEEADTLESKSNNSCNVCQQQQQQQQHLMDCFTTNGSCSPHSSPSTPHTIDSLAVLREEDEKDLLSCVNIGSSNKLPCAVTEQRSTSSVSTLAQLPTDSLSPMAPLQTHTECQSVQCLNILEKDYKSSSTSTSSSSPPQKPKRSFQHQLSIPESLQATSIGCATSSEHSSARSLKHSEALLDPLQTLNPSGSLRSISPSRRSASSNSSSTAKHEQSTTAAATAAAAATATTSNGSPTSPPEKEKKGKEISSSRIKKFHRHFSQVSKDEKLINYFSCALVSDILLQGHLYITDRHFAFYSNVFGYVTKVVIPTSSVTKISKEKTAKIIPNAVGVATADERHVFGSFISRESAFRLMCSVCPPLRVAEILPKDPANIEISEEYSIEDDSSCSISGNESPAQSSEQQNNSTYKNLLNNGTSQTILRRSVGSSNLSITDKLRLSDIPTNAKAATTNTASSRASAPPATQYKNGDSTTNGSGTDGDGGAIVNLVGLKSVLQPAIASSTDMEGKLTIIAGSTSTTTTTSSTSTPTPSTSSSPTTVMTLSSSKAAYIMNTLSSVSKKCMTHLKFPTEIHVVYLGVLLTLLLAVFTIFLLYRILDIEAKANGYRSPLEFNWRSGNDDDILNEALRFQKQLQLKSTEEAENILKTNLEQIAKVRRSLETLSMLIHDRSTSFVSTNTDKSD